MGTGWEATARGVLSTTFLGVQMGCPGAASWAVQGQLQHTELLSCSTDEEGDGCFGLSLVSGRTDRLLPSLQPHTFASE